MERLGRDVGPVRPCDRAELLVERCLTEVRRVAERFEFPKGRRFRFVSLAQPAVEALARVARRGEFISPDDYVFCNVWGRRLDISALRRRYKRACAAAGLRPVKLHGLRHAAGSIVARTIDPVFVAFVVLPTEAVGRFP